MPMRKDQPDIAVQPQTVSGLLCRSARRLVKIAAFLSILGAGAQTAFAYSAVSLTAGTPESVEQTFVADTTSWFQATVTTNPFVANTFTIKLSGIRSQPVILNPIDATSVMNNFIAQSTTTYVYGFADGQSYERHTDLGTMGEYAVNCSSPTFFDVVNGTTTITPKIDLATCDTILSELQDEIFTQNFSTPTVIPPVPGQ